MRLGSLAALASFALAVGCRTERPMPRAASAAHLVLSETRFDFGAALTHDDLHHAFGIRNTGGALLEIASIEAGHDCSVTVQAVTLNANGSAELDVHCRPEQYGSFTSTVVLSSNAPDALHVVLELDAEVAPRLAWKEPVLALELQFGRDQREELELVGARARDAHLSLRDMADAGLGLEIAHSDAGDRLAIVAPGHPVGTRIGELRVATGLDDPAELALPFSYTVTGTLKVDPSNPYFDLLSARGRQVELTVASSQPGFRLRAVDVLDGPFQASFVGSPSGAYHATVTFLAERANDEQRGTLGHLRLRSNDRSEPEKVLILTAFGSALAAPRP